MPENMSKLEELVEKLIEELTKLRASNEQLRGTVADREQTIQELEGDKHNVKQAVGSSDGDPEERQSKLHRATEKLDGLIARLESVG
jgi:chromosome segregation ATPase